MAKLTNSGLETPYYSVTLVALVAGAQHYYDHLKTYVANIRGVTMTPQDDEQGDLDRIRQVNTLRVPQDGPDVPTAHDREAEGEINRSLVPYVVFSPNLFDTVLKNVVPEGKFEARYTGVDGKRYYIKTRAVSFGMKAKTYVTNWAQALVIAEYLLAATPNTMRYHYPMFNLPRASVETMETEGNLVLSGPSIRRVYKRENDGHLYCITQDVVLNFTVGVLPPGHQEDDGTSSDDAAAAAPLVERYNLDLWEGLVREDNDANWLAGVAITNDGTRRADAPTARDLP